MTRLIVVRHGYSTSNASGTYTGHLDAPLHEIGHAQAAQLAAHLCQAEQIDAIYASDLQRAIQTIRPTADRAGLPLHTTRALRELDVGLWTGMPYGEVRERFAADFAAYRQSIDAPCTGGESLRAACERIWSCVQKIVDAHSGGTVVICSHALCSRLFAALAETGRVEDVTAFEAPPNAAFSTYVYENGRLRVLCKNHTQHLETPTQTALRGLV